MNNPWGVKLKKTGFNDKRLASEQSILNNLEQRQNELQNMALTNASKQNAYEDRQASLVADAMAGQQERLIEQVGKKGTLKKKTISIPFYKLKGILSFSFIK